MDKMLIAVRRGTRHRNVAKMSLATEVRLMKYLYIIDTAPGRNRMWFHSVRPRHTSSDAVRPAVGQLARLSVSLKLICTVEQNNLQSRPVPQSQIYG